MALSHLVNLEQWLNHIFGSAQNHADPDLCGKVVAIIQRRLSGKEDKEVSARRDGSHPFPFSHNSNQSPRAYVSSAEVFGRERNKMCRNCWQMVLDMMIKDKGGDRLIEKRNGKVFHAPR